MFVSYVKKKEGKMNTPFIESHSYVVALCFGVFTKKDNSFLGVETWYLGKNKIVPEVYEAQIFQSESKAITFFHACYKDVIKNFIASSDNLLRQWDGFVHINSIYIKPGRAEQFDPIDINNVVKYKGS